MTISGHLTTRWGRANTSSISLICKIKESGLLSGPNAPADFGAGISLLAYTRSVNGQITVFRELCKQRNTTN